jgi:hypothetical protein
MAISEALRTNVNSALTAMDLSGNSIGKTAASVIGDAVCENNISGLAWLNLDGFALPIKQLKGTDPVTEVDLSEKGRNLRSASGIVIASCLYVNAPLRLCNVRGNQLDTESAIKLSGIATEKRIMIFGIEHNQASADLSGANLSGASMMFCCSCDMMMHVLMLTQPSRASRR